MGESNLVSLFLMFLACLPISSAGLVVPSSALVIAGQSTTLKCPTIQGSSPTWSIQYLNDRLCSVNGVGSTSGSCARPSFRISLTSESLNGYSAVSTFHIDNTSLADAGTYTCSSYNHNWQFQQGRAVLTVLANSPSGEATENYVTAGQTLTYTCRVQYNGSTLLRMSWTDTSNNRKLDPSGGDTTTSHNHNNVISQQSILSITVPPEVATVKPVTCTVYAPNADDSRISYQWKSSEIRVSYCPTNVAILATDDSLAVGTQLTCLSDAYPRAVYRWRVTGGVGGSVSGNGNSTLTVTSMTSQTSEDDVIEFRCTAVNFLQGNDQTPCYVSTSVTVSRR